MTEKEKQIQEGIRLQEILNSLNLKGNRFAKEVGVSQALVSSTVSGQKPITRNFVNKITERYPNFREAWIFTGEGPIWNDGNPVETYQINESLPLVEDPDPVGYGLFEKLQQEVVMLRNGMEVLKARIDELEGKDRKDRS